MKKSAKVFFLLLNIFCFVFLAGAQEEDPKWSRLSNLTPKEELEIFRAAYPWVDFELDYDKQVKDWALKITSYKKTTTLYRAEGLYLPKEELPNRDHYWRVIYKYTRTLDDPANFSEEKKQMIRDYASTENRKNGAVSSKFIFGAIYDCATRAATESHLRSMTLWNKPVNMHRQVGKVLDKVEAKVWKLAKTDKEVAAFLKAIVRCYGYNWRQIRDSPTRSFHSYGIAVDILPKNWGNKIVYWGYEKQKGNKNWMLIPLKSRWMPPAAVIKAFEDEGFIWGGRWAIWDNMHFEYHPELFAAQELYGEKLK
ncbi:MAG: M15 family metallopeptidase [Treponema sp.]|nr:M15 family metallopeptidase [Treponema sp.]